VDGQVVQDDVHVQFGGHVRVDGAKEIEELLVAAFDRTDHVAGGDLQGGEQAGGG
jgi:hypothetical protein